jgi:hypothetical protein
MFSFSDNNDDMFISLNEDNDIVRDKKEIKLKIQDPPNNSQEIKSLEEAEKKTDQKLDSILSTFHSTPTIYAILRKSFRSSFFCGKAMPLITLGTTAATIFCWTKYISYMNSSNQDCDLFWQNLKKDSCGLPGSYAVSGCDYMDLFGGSIDVICQQLWNAAQANFSTARYYLGGGIPNTLFTIIFTSCYSGNLYCLSPHLTIEDYLPQNEINFLMDYSILRDTSIREAAKSVQAIKDSRDIRKLLSPDVWKIVQDYLAPLSKKIIFNLATINKEAKANSKFIAKLTTSKILKHIKSLEQRADHLENNFNGFQDMKDVATALPLYDTMVAQAEQAQLLAATMNVYHEVTKKRAHEVIMRTPRHLPTRKHLSIEHDAQSNDHSEVIDCNKITSQICEKLNLFAKNIGAKALDNRENIRTIINDKAKVDENREAVNFLGFTIKHQL